MSVTRQLLCFIKQEKKKEKEKEKDEKRSRTEGKSEVGWCLVAVDP